MNRTFSFLLPLLAAAGLGLGCTAVHTKPLTDQEFPAVPRDSVRVFVGVPEEPHLRLAFINSDPDLERSVRRKREQIEQLRHRAARLGADAVVDVQLLREERRGFQPDPATPIRSWRQGDSELWFLRGVAIKFLVEDEAEILEYEEAAAGMTLEEKRASIAEGLQEITDFDAIPEVETRRPPRRPEQQPRTLPAF